MQRKQVQKVLQKTSRVNEKVFGSLDKMMIELIILSFFIFVLALSIFLKKFWLGFFSLICIVLCGIWYFFFREPVFKFLFRNDEENIEAHPEVYCGDDLVLPEDYDVFGTRYKCLRKGIGTGMVLSNNQRDAFLARQRQPNPERVYCGNNGQLPGGFDRNGTLLECFKKGVGTGLGMPQAKRLAVQQRPPRLGKIELIKLAEKFKVNHNILTRDETRDIISDRLRQTPV